MSSRFVAPIVSIIVGLVLLIIAVVNLPNSTSGMFDESVAYFVKQVEPNKILLVEPNMTDFMSSKKTTPSSDVLYEALDEIKQTYEVDDTELVQMEFKGVQVPRLYVYVHPNH
jgi:hypothetical protein